MTQPRIVLAGAALSVALFSVSSCSSDGSPSATRSSSPSPSAASSAQVGRTVSGLISAGLAQVSGGQLDAATNTFDAVLDLDPHNVYALYNLGYIAQTRGDDATAVKSYADALSLQKDFSPALYNLAILTEASDLTSAVDLYRREVAVNPDDAAAFMRLGFALRHLGHRTEAATMLARGIAIDPSMADVAPPAYS